MMDRLKKLLGATMLTSVMITGAARAEGEFTSAVGLTSDYVFRGVTQTLNNPAIPTSLAATTS